MGNGDLLDAAKAIRGTFPDDRILSDMDDPQDSGSGTVFPVFRLTIGHIRTLAAAIQAEEARRAELAKVQESLMESISLLDDIEELTGPDYEYAEQLEKLTSRIDSLLYGVLANLLNSTAPVSRDEAENARLRAALDEAERALKVTESIVLHEGWKSEEVFDEDYNSDAHFPDGTFTMTFGELRLVFSAIAKLREAKERAQ